MFKKRVIPFLLSVLMIISMLPNYVYAATVAEKLDNLRNTNPQFQVGYKGWGNEPCWKFVNAVSKEVFGVNALGGTQGLYMLADEGKNSNWTLIGREMGGSGANTRIGNLLKRAQPGDIIQYRSEKVSKHTAMIVATSTSPYAVSIYDCSSNWGVTLRYMTLNNIAYDPLWGRDGGVGNFEGASQYGLSLYRCTKNSTNSSGGTYTPPTNNQPSQPTISTPVTNKVNFSNIKASNISETNAKLSASVSYSGTRPSEVGIYLGNSTGSMRKVGSDKINHSKNPFDMWYDLNKCGVTLSAGTQYYYKMYAIVNGKEFTSGTKNFFAPITIMTAPEEKPPKITAPTSTVDFSNIKASNISETNAKLSASVSYSGKHPSEVGIYLGDSTGSMRKVSSDKINHSKNPFDMWYDLNKHGVTLSAGTQYYYKMYAIVDGNEFTSKTKNFWTSLTISVNSGSEKKNPDPVGMPAVSVDGSTVSVSWNSVANATKYDVYLLQDPWRWEDVKYRGSTQGTSYTFTNVRDGAYCAFVISRPNPDSEQSYWKGFNVKATPTSTADFYNINASNVSQTNAQLNASISYSGNHPSEVGVYFGNSADSMRKVGSDAINHNKNPFDMWYSLNKYGVTLSAGTTYYYKMYAIMDGREVTSSVQSFTTPAQVNSNLVTARVSGTPGGLAINSQPNQYTKIGRMDEGVYCTIDLSRTSGNWYYVTYNGVSGYAYNRYLVIQ